MLLGGKVHLSTDGIHAACRGCPTSICPSRVPALEGVQDLLAICLSLPVSVVLLLSLKQFCYTVCCCVFLTEFQKALCTPPLLPSAEHEPR